MKRIAILTSGGDAPGMNAAIRAATRCAIERGWQVVGVRDGYSGLLADHFVPLETRSVSGVIQQGGTLLGSARCRAFEQEPGRAIAAEILERRGIEALIVIGGNGSQTGACMLARLGVTVMGVASTIDNDLVGSDLTIGVDTALNIALEAIDRLKTTASSHHRGFLVEVMGRHCGYLALMAGIAGGAEVIVIPEIEITAEQIAETLQNAYRRGKAHAIAVVAEGAHQNAERLSAYFAENRARIGFDLRTTTLGHVQRGGAPTAYDRILGSRLGADAIMALERGERGKLCGVVKGELALTPLEEVVGKQKPIDPELFRLAQALDS